MVVNCKGSVPKIPERFRFRNYRDRLPSNIQVWHWNMNWWYKICFVEVAEMCPFERPVTLVDLNKLLPEDREDREGYVWRLAIFTILFFIFYSSLFISYVSSSKGLTLQKQLTARPPDFWLQSRFFRLKPVWWDMFPRFPRRVTDLDPIFSSSSSSLKAHLSCWSLWCTLSIIPSRSRDSVAHGFPRVALFIWRAVA